MKKTIIPTLFLAFFLIFLSRNSFAEEKYFFVFLNINPEKEVIPDSVSKELMKSHFANIDKMVSLGKLVAAGPMVGGGGIFILNASSANEVDSLLQYDNAIKANRWNLEILQMTVKKGSFCKVPEKYEMILYGFIRYKSGSTAAEKLLNRGELVNKFFFQADFPDKGESIAICYMKKDELNFNELAAESIIYVKDLYSAKGSFCE